MLVGRVASLAGIQLVALGGGGGLGTVDYDCLPAIPSDHFSFISPPFFSFQTQSQSAGFGTPLELSTWGREQTA